MLKPERIPTPLLTEAEKPPPLELTVDRLEERARHPTRRFVGFLLRNAWRKLWRRYDVERAAVELRVLMEELGGLWVKVGQLMSLRTDVLDPAFARELSRLQYRSVAFPPADARAVIEAELGRPIGEVFSRYAERPIAAASISQVHRAVLRDHDREVVIKVQRPGIDRRFARDLGAIRRFIGWMKRLDVSPHMQWDDALWELEQIAFEEVDFRYEASNMKRMRKSLKEHKVYVPKVYLEHSTARVLVMEYVEGVLMSDYIRILEHEPLRARVWEGENCVDPEKVGERLFLSAMRQLLEDNLFHADLHPGNIILLRDSRVALIDLGSVGTVDQEFLFFYTKAMEALGTGDLAKGADYQLRLASNLPIVDLANLREEMIRAFRRWGARSQLENVPYHEKNLASAGQEVGRILFEHKIQLSWAFMKITRTWSTLDASLQYLIPGAAYQKLIRRHFEDASRRRWSRRNLVKGVLGAVARARSTVDEYEKIIGPALRRHTLVFQGTTGKMARAWAIVQRTFSWLVVAATVAGAYVFLHQHHTEVVDEINDHPHLVTVLDDVPHIGYLWWLGIFAVAVTCVVMLRRIASMLDKKEYHW